MRLIDADALEKEFCSGCQYEHNKYVNCIDCPLAQAPTVNVALVVHDFGTNTNRYFHCSICGGRKNDAVD